MHVVTEAGQNVSGAQVHFDQLLSTVVPAAGTTPAYRVTPIGLDMIPRAKRTTGSDGVVTLTTYQLEPDEATWRSYQHPSDAIRYPPGPYVTYQPQPTDVRLFLKRRPTGG